MQVELFKSFDRLSYSPAAIFVYRDNPYDGEQLPAASFSIGGKEYKDVIPYFTDGQLLSFNGN